MIATLKDARKYRKRRTAEQYSNASTPDAAHVFLLRNESLNRDERLYGQLDGESVDAVGIDV